MNGGISTSSPGVQSSIYYARIPSKTLTSSLTNKLWTSSLIPYSSPPPKFSLSCNSTTGPSGPGENENRTVLDAFFLGKALAEAVNERIESTVGEFLSTIGRLQAEQQKQVLDFQEEVLERAKNAKEKAAREAMEAQGLVPKSSSSSSSSSSSTAIISTGKNGVTSITVSSTTDDSPSISQSSATPNVMNGDDEQNPIDRDS